MAKSGAKKNKNLFIIIGVVVVLAVGAGAYALLRGGNPVSDTVNVATGKSVKCEYVNEEGAQSVAYVKGEKFRLDSTGGSDGNVSAIFKDSTSWWWDNDTKEGMKMTIAKVESDGETGDASEGNFDMDIEEEVNEHQETCKNEVIPDNMFDVPGDVTFQDYSQMMQEMQNSTPEEMQEQFQQYLPQE